MPVGVGKQYPMSDPNSTSNVKIYDRPEKKGPNPLVLVLALLILVVLAFGIYRAMHVAGSAPASAEDSRANSATKSAASP